MDTASQSGASVAEQVEVHPRDSPTTGHVSHHSSDMIEASLQPPAACERIAVLDSAGDCGEKTERQDTPANLDTCAKESNVSRTQTEHLVSPLSPKDVRNRLVDMVQHTKVYIDSGLSKPVSTTPSTHLPSQQQPAEGGKEEVRAHLDSQQQPAEGGKEEAEAHLDRGGEEEAVSTSSACEADGGTVENPKSLESSDKEEQFHDHPHLDDIETSSVLSMEQLTESLQNDSLTPLPVPAAASLWQSSEKIPISFAGPASRQTDPHSPHTTPTRLPKHSKYAVASASGGSLGHVTMPQHLKPMSQTAAKPRLPFPPGYISEPSYTAHTGPSPRSHLSSPVTQTHSSQSQANNSPTTPSSSNPATTLSASSSQHKSPQGRWPMEALHSKAHLEGQLESIVEECSVLLKERAELQSKLALAQTEVEQMKVGRSEVERPVAVAAGGERQTELARLREELRLAQRGLEEGKKSLAVAREEAHQERLHSGRLKSEVEKMRTTVAGQRELTEELQRKVQEGSTKLSEEKAAAEEAHHQLSSLQASYKALEDSKVWMQEQLHDAMETKIELQKALRDSKASSIAAAYKLEQLSRENASFQQQISQLQKGVLQDKAKLVSQLEAIEADVLSREDSYAELVAEKVRLQELAQQRAGEMERVSTAVAQAQVEREEMEREVKEGKTREESLEDQCRTLVQQREDTEKRMKKAEGDLVAKKEDAERLQKLTSTLQERLRAQETVLADREGSLQGLRDARDMLTRELDMVRLAQGQTEKELEGVLRKVAELEASLSEAETESVNREGMVRSTMDTQQQWEAEGQSLRDRLAKRDKEVEEKVQELATMHLHSQEVTAKCQNLTSQLHSLAGDRDSLKNAIAEKDRVLRKLSQEKASAIQEALSLRSDRDSLQSQLTEALQQKSHLEGQLSEYSSLSGLEDAVRERSALQVQLDSLRLSQQQELLKMQGRLRQTESELSSAKKEIGRTVKQAERALQAKEEALSKLSAVKLESKSSLGELKCALEQAQQERQAAERETVLLRQELKDMQLHTQQLEQSHRSVAEQLLQESAQKGEVERASGLVALQLKQNAEKREQKLQQQNQELCLELEHLKGRLAGISATQQAMRIHTGELEATLAQKDGSLAKMGTEVQRVLEEKHDAESQLHSQTQALEEEVSSLRAELSEAQEQLHLEQLQSENLSRELAEANGSLASLRSEQLLQGREVPALEEKVSSLLQTRGELQSELAGLRGQLVAARAAARAAETQARDRESQLGVLQQKLVMADLQCQRAEGEAEQARQQLQSETERQLMELEEARKLLGENCRESTAMGEGLKAGVFDSSFSSIGAEEEVDGTPQDRPPGTHTHTQY